MKQKRVERAERRRPLVEINLIGDTKPRSANRARRGCGPLLGQGAVLLATLVAAFLAAHPGLR